MRFLTPLIILFVFAGCEVNESFPSSTYDCSLSIADSSNTHSKADSYQAILDRNQINGMVGAVLLVNDANGLWIGASGSADLASKVDMKPCNTFLIASISKVFTAAAVFRLVDRGIISLDDPISDWLNKEMTEKIANTRRARISHLLSHTSGIPDYYTDRFELDRSNRINNQFSKEEVITYIYGKEGHFKPGNTYEYSNTNYLLLAIILENVTGNSFEEVYQNEVFDPLDLSTAYYSETKTIPDGCVRGYADIGANGTLIDAQHLYKDELGIGGDGGVAINAYDLFKFLHGLMSGNLISDNSLEEMTNWFDLPSGWHWDTYGQTENGYGLEKFNTDYGFAVGHTGGIDGFNTFGFYFPETGFSYILFVNNTRAFDTAKSAIFRETLAKMFSME